MSYIVVLVFPADYVHLCPKEMESKGRNSHIAIIIMMLFLSFAYLNQSTNNGKTLPEDLGQPTSSERGKGVTYTTKQTEVTPPPFQATC